MNEEYIEPEYHWLHVFALEFDEQDKKHVRLLDGEHYSTRYLSKSQFGELIEILQQFYDRMEH
jgi:hypothetical protein